MASPSDPGPKSRVAPQLVQFGPFEVNLQTGELRKQGIRIRLQPKPWQVLRTLLENPGTVVTREELRSRLWPEDTFIDFESGVNTAINRLRLALSDSADHPRYIETLSRSGYRFIGHIHTLPPVPTSIVEVPSPRKSSWYARLLRPAVVLLGLAIVVFGALRFQPAARNIQYRQVTFRRGQVAGARFTSDQQAIVYAAQWDKDPRQFYLAASDSPTARALGFEGFSLAAVSKSGELALLRSGGTANITGGTLYRVAINGGPTQHVDHNIFGADWSADGSRLAIVRVVAGEQQLEYPLGHILYRTAGWLSNVRIAPLDGAVAFIDHPVRHDDAGAVKIVDLAGSVRTLSDGWANLSGMAWKNTGELWFTATRDHTPRSLWSVTTDGRLRAVGQAPGMLTLRDIARDGRLLLTIEARRLEIAGWIAGDPGERTLSLTDWSRVQQLSADGGLLLFDESGEGAGPHTLSYLRRTRTGEIVRLGEGVAQALTADGSAALLLSESRTRLRLVPTSGGAGRDLPASGLQYQWARLFPAGDRLLALANRPKQPLRLWVQSVADGSATELTGPLMVRNAAVAPDGKTVAILTPEGQLTIYTIGSAAPRVIPADEPLAPIRWSRDGEWLFVQHLRSNVQASSEVSRLRIATGERVHWKTLAPQDAIGVNSITGVVIADDERSYAYSYRRVLSDLFVADGWK